MPFMDDPIADFSIFPTYLLSKLARQDVTVVLSGDGGDEIFGGYETYVAQQHAAIWQRAPAFLRKRFLEPMLCRLPPQPQKKGLLNRARRFGEGLKADPRLGHSRWRLFTDQAQRTELFTPDLLVEAGSIGQHILDLNERAGSRSEIDRSLYVDMKSYLSDNCLVKVDRMSMACSLEARVPLLDHELVELAFRMPAMHKVLGTQTKPLLKRVAAQRVPAQAIYRSKEGFSIPIKSWLSREFRPLMEELLAPARFRGDGLIEPEAVDRLKREHLSGHANHSHILWGLIVLQDWRQRWSA
jgi:asparagine synthase (glutamine-hydrolysing)